MYDLDQMLESMGKKPSIFFLRLHSTMPALERGLSNNALVWWRFSIIKVMVTLGAASLATGLVSVS